MTSGISPSGLFCALLLALCVSGADARVSLRIRGNVDAVIASAGGTVVYRADVEVNGCPGTIRVFGFEEGVDTVGALLMTRLGLNDEPRREGAQIRLPERFGPGWLFVLPGMTGDVSSAMLLTASGRPDETSPVWLFPRLPQPPGFSLTFSARDREARMALCVGESPLPQRVALSTVRGIMERDGWTVATPAADRVSAIFLVKGDNVALVSAVSRDGGSRLLLMTSQR